MKPSSAYGIHRHSMVSEDSTRADRDRHHNEHEERKPQFEDTVIYDEPFR